LFIVGATTAISVPRSLLPYLKLTEREAAELNPLDVKIEPTKPPTSFTFDTDDGRSNNDGSFPFRLVYADDAGAPI